MRAAQVEAGARGSLVRTHVAGRPRNRTPVLSTAHSRLLVPTQSAPVLLSLAPSVLQGNRVAAQLHSSSRAVGMVSCRGRAQPDGVRVRGKRLTEAGALVGKHPLVIAPARRSRCFCCFSAEAGPWSAAERAHGAPVCAPHVVLAVRPPRRAPALRASQPPLTCQGGASAGGPQSSTHARLLLLPQLLQLRCSLPDRGQERLHLGQGVGLGTAGACGNLMQLAAPPRGASCACRSSADMRSVADNERG